MKRRIVISFLALLAFVIVSRTWAMQTAVPDSLVLARVEVTGKIDQLHLPVYAHLQAADSHDYALVIAPESQLIETGAGYRVLDRNAQGAAYVIGTEVQAGGRQRAAQFGNVLLDDGRQVILRSTPDQTEALVGTGLEIQWLDQTPIVLSASKAVTVSAVHDSRIAEMISKISQDTIHTYVGNLSGENAVLIGGSNYTITSRYTSSGMPIQKATQYLYEQMQNWGLPVSYQSWTSGNYSGRNVIGVKAGTSCPEEIVLVSAHLDDKPSGSVAPGADDNASGSVAVMAIAEIVRQYDFARTIRLVDFTGEEQGHLGSKAYASKVYGDNDNIVVVYNIDMIAWDDTDGPTLRLHTRTGNSLGYAGDLIIAHTFVDVVDTYSLSNLSPIIAEDGLASSDHNPFWDKGYSGILAIEDEEDDFNPNWHKTTDRRSVLNMAYFTNFIKASVGTVAHLASSCGSESTPTPTIIPTSTPTPTPTPGPNCSLGDANNDEKVDLEDFKFVMARFLQNPIGCTDQNRDGKVNILDFGQILLAVSDQPLSPTPTGNAGNGQFFPFGFMGATTADFDPIAETGANIVHTFGQNRNTSQSLAYLDAAGDHGLKVILDLPRDEPAEGWSSFVNAVASHSALWA